MESGTEDETIYGYIQPPKGCRATAACPWFDIAGTVAAAIQVFIFRNIYNCSIPAL